MTDPAFLKLLHLVIAIATTMEFVRGQSPDSSSSLFNYVGIPHSNGPSAWPKAVNATGQISQPVFKTPDLFYGIGGTWTWTSAVYEGNPMEGDSMNVPVWISEQLWLRTEPEQSLFSRTPYTPDSPYVGCLFVFQDLPIATAKVGQNDDGTCSSIFSPSCIDALQSSFRHTVLTHQNQSYDPPWGGPPLTNQTSICRDVAWDFSMPSECVNATGTEYSNSSLISVQYAGMDANQSDVGTCNEQNDTPLINGGSGQCTRSSFLDDPSQPLATWFFGTSEVDATNISTAYDLALTSITPIISTLFTVNFPHIPWSDAKLGCLRPTNVTAGSRKPAGDPQLSAAGNNKPCVLGKSLILGMLSIIVVVMYA